jgi:hypothetical protein
VTFALDILFNDMELTPEEIKYAEKFIRRLEKDTRHWKWMRWAMLITSILIWGSATFTYFKLAEIQELVTSIFSTPRTNFDSRTIELFVEGRISNLRLEFIVLLRITLQVIFGAIWFVYCLVNWNRHIKSGLIAKALRRLAFNQ